MRDATRIELPIHPRSVPFLVAMPQRPRAALTAAWPPDPNAQGVEYVLWHATPGDPIAQASAPLALSTGLLGGGVYSIVSSFALGQFAIGGHNGVLQFDAETLAVRAAWALPNRGHSEDHVQGLVFSPDGRYIAVTGGGEQAALIPLDTTGARKGVPVGVNPGQPEQEMGKVSPMGSMEVGEYTACLTFTPDGRTLIAGCSYQGGTSVAIANVDVASGALLNPREIERSHYGTPMAEFCTWMLSVAASPSGRRLALYETDEDYGRGKSPGWRGILSVADAPFTEVHWSAPIDARLTGETHPFDMSPMRRYVNYNTDAIFLSEDEIACGAPAGHLLCFDAGTGALTREIALPLRYQSAEVRGLATGMAPGELWCCVILDDVYQVLCLDARR